jgi:medium-chain acyl-[acyl-carrier-protein] hydrolase
VTSLPWHDPTVALTEPGSRWVRWYREDPAPAVRLVCFPHAGGGASTFATWAPLLPPAVELVAVQLPGREDRIREPAPTDLGRLLDELGVALTFAEGVPVALLGHSWGALLAFELARRFEQRDHPVVTRLIVSGSRAPHCPSLLPPISGLPRAEFLDALRKLGGIHPEVLAHEGFLDIVLPTVRADLRLAEKYRHVAGRPLACPITVLGGTADPMTSAASLDAWSGYTTGACRRHMFDGDHFFFVGGCNPIVAVIAESLTGDGRRP